MRYQAVTHADGKAAVVDTFLRPPCNVMCECDRISMAEEIAKALELQRFMAIGDAMIEVQRKLIQDTINKAVAEVVKGLQAKVVDWVREATRAF